MAWTCLTPCLVTFFVLGIASAHVAPPSDVILHCGNLVNKVAWRYDNPPAGLRYRVDFGKVFNSQGDVGPLWVYPPDLQADLSFLSDQREDYFLAVTAVLGEEESEAAPADGITFSYYRDSPATQKCSLDLPPATVSDQQDNSVLISFQHPWLKYWHGRKRRHEKLDNPLPVFKYDVILDKKQFADLRCTEKTCERTLPVDAGQEKHCAAIRGELESISVHGTQDYCALPVQGNKHVIIAVVVSLLVLAVVSTVLLLVCLKKTKSSSNLPPSLRFERTIEEARPDTSLPVSNSSAPLMVVGTSPVSTDDSEPLREPEPSVGGDADDAGDTVEEVQQGYMGGEQMQEDEDTATSEENAYERRQVIVSLSPDEDVEGYRG
ncbi:interferon gamma receptor 1-like precursor [Hippocampus comes]|uniref:Interferon gamma receptor 1-like n=1 Tax=Hippocampus comes TaxID=109280 RepID=A0A3Q2Y9U1_HIPCM|nr:interferon gamma receptor 1-like precursor [Hippocampus comes]